jgi:biopolymer transport protein TolR
MGFQNSSKKGPVSEINVTPLVDVMLVLLVIFMVTAPMLMSGIDLKLPKTKKVMNLNPKPEMVMVSLTANDQVYLGKEQIRRKELIKKVKEALKITKSEVVFIRGDYSLKYEKVAKLMAELKNAGISQLALVTETEKNESP